MSQFAALASILNQQGGGTPPPWAPDDIAGLIAWWDASDTATITDTGGAVSQWNDKSTSARHASQGTGSLQPTTGAATQNGLNVVTFAADRLNFTAIAALSVPRTYFFVTKKDAVSSKECIFGSTDGGYWIMHPASATTGAPTTRRASATASAPASLAVNTYGIISVTDTGGTTGALKIGLNGSYSAAVTGSTTNSTWTALGAYPAASSFSLQGAIAEVLVYDSVLGTSDLALVESYLNDKWAVY